MRLSGKSFAALTNSTPWRTTWPIARGSLCYNFAHALTKTDWVSAPRRNPRILPVAADPQTAEKYRRRARTRHRAASGCGAGPGRTPGEIQTAGDALRTHRPQHQRTADGRKTGRRGES